MCKIAKILITSLIISNCINKDSIKEKDPNESTLYKIDLIGTFQNNNHNVKGNYDYFSSGKRAHIYIFHEYNTQYPLHQYPYRAIARNYGSLYIAPEIYLKQSKISIYSISYNNSNDIEQVIYQGKFRPLYNDIDYIWASVKYFSLYQNSQIILPYKHLCAQLLFKIYGIHNINNISINQVNITLPSSQDAYISVKDQTIISPNQILEPTNIQMSNLESRRYIVIPYSGNIHININANITLSDGSQIEKQYSGYFNANLVEGYSYIIEINIDNNPSKPIPSNINVTVSSEPWDERYNSIIYEKLK